MENDHPMTNAEYCGYKISYWINPTEVSALFSADYWNDRNEERGKPFDVTDGDFHKMKSYLANSHLMGALNSAINSVHLLGVDGLKGVGADLAAGVLWAAPVILGNANVKKLFCVEFSQHRLLEIGPRVLSHHGIDPERVELCLGSFYELKLEAGSLDFVLLSQAFHHADRPLELLSEIARVLKPGGLCLITGEPRIHRKRFFHRQCISFAKFAVSLVPQGIQRKVFSRPVQRPRHLIAWNEERPQPHPILGDHYYFLDNYFDFFENAGFESKQLQDNYPDRSFILKSKA